MFVVIAKKFYICSAICYETYLNLTNKMKKTLLVILAVLCGLSAMAQDEKEIKVRRPKYVNVGYVLQQNMTLATGEVIKPKFGATINRGRTFYFHKKPIGNFFNVGLDATWADINYAMYKPQTLESTLHQAEIAVQVGPSITLTPAKRLQMHFYGRFAPTFALRYDGSKVGGNYASLFVAGGNISYGFFGIGAEYRGGKNMTYKEFGGGKLGDIIGGITGGSDEEDLPSEAFVSRAVEGATDGATDTEVNPFFGSKNVLQGLRIYITFRF